MSYLYIWMYSSGGGVNLMKLLGGGGASCKSSETFGLDAVV
jgi:hypothetical protein